MSLDALVHNFNTFIINPVLAVLFAFAMLVFVWGIIEFLIAVNYSGDHGKQEDGKRHMLWGLIGIFIMVSAYAILEFIASNACGSLSACKGTFQ
jgi:hypothetical protein